MFQVGTILFEQNQQVCIVAYQMFRYPRVRLTEIEAIDVRVAAHRKVFSHSILLIARNVVEDKDRIGTCLARWNDVTVVGERARNHESLSSKNVSRAVASLRYSGLSAEQLQYIPKVVLLRVCGNYIDHVWDKLPEYIKADLEVQTYRRCVEHYNQSWDRDHIDGPAPRIKDCGLCQQQRQTKATLEICSIEL
ncbi:hypothetical protein P5V15_014378 [Pogonomyrmex californicus]